MPNTTINWAEIIEQAKQAYQRAYAPYSNFSVGCAALTTAGDIVSGCNVENASYGLTVCAERNCIAQGIIHGQHKFKALVVYTEETLLTPPCGACRQVIAEFMSPTAPVMAVNHLSEQKRWTVAELLPDAFTPKNLQLKTQLSAKE